MKRSTLPARGFEIHPAFIRSRRIAMGVCIAILALTSVAAIYIASDILAMRREAAIWAHGTVAPDARVNVKTTVKVVFVDYKVDVAYTAPDGPHTAVEEFVTAGPGAILDGRATLRYDAEHPEDFATNTGIGSTAGRWRWIAAMDGFLVFVAIVMALQVRRSRREIRRTRAIAHDGDEIVATIISSTPVTLSNGRATPYVVFKWRTGDHGPFATQHDKRRGDLARTGRDGEAIAVLSTDGKVGMLLAADLYPLLATEPEIRAAEQLRKAMS